MCAGLVSATLLKPLGLKIPMAAVYGYFNSSPMRKALNISPNVLMELLVFVGNTRPDSLDRKLAHAASSLALTSGAEIKHN